MPVTGIPAFDAVALLEVESLDFTTNDVHLVAHAAFVSTTSGATFGRTKCQRWSKETLDTLKLLRDLMELDIANMVFIGGGATAGGPLTSKEPEGIKEHAGAVPDVPSI
jgi:hypothetical protein